MRRAEGEEGPWRGLIGARPQRRSPDGGIWTEQRGKEVSEVGSSEFPSIRRGAETLGADQREGARNLPARAPGEQGTGTGTGTEARARASAL